MVEYSYTVGNKKPNPTKIISCEVGCQNSQVHNASTGKKL